MEPFATQHNTMFYLYLFTSFFLFVFRIRNIQSIKIHLKPLSMQMEYIVGFGTRLLLYSLWSPLLGKYTFYSILFCCHTRLLTHHIPPFPRAHKHGCAHTCTNTIFKSIVEFQLDFVPQKPTSENKQCIPRLYLYLYLCVRCKFVPLKNNSASMGLTNSIQRNCIFICRKEIIGIQMSRCSHT